MTLTKADFADSLFEELGIDRREAKALVELFFEEIKDSLEPVYDLFVTYFSQTAFG